MNEPVLLLGILHGSRLRGALHHDTLRLHTAALISFVMTHFGHFLRIACLSLGSDPTNISAEEFDLLAPVLCGGNELSSALARLSEANPQFAGQKSIPAKELRKWLERNLQWNDE